MGTQGARLLGKFSCSTEVDGINSSQRIINNFTYRKDLHVLKKEYNSICLTWSAN